MIGVIQTSPAPYRENTFLACEKKFSWRFNVATFPDGMDTHPEWCFRSLKEDYIGHAPKTFKILGRKLVYNSDIYRWLKSEKFEAILIEGYNSFTNIFAIIYCLLKKIPIILGVDSVENPGFKIIKKFLYRNVSAFWVPGIRTKKYLLSEGVVCKKIYFGKYTYDYGDLFKIVKQTDQVSLKKTYNISDDEIVFLFVGKLIASRNVSLLLNAFREIQNDNVKLIIIGDGPDEDKVMNCGDDRVIYIPRVPLSELYGFYAISDIYIHPGAEPFSLAVVQAVASNLIVIASNKVGAVDDVVKENGLLLSKYSVEELVASIKFALKNFDFMKSEAYKMGNFVRNERSVQFASDQLNEAIKYVINSK